MFRLSETFLFEIKESKCDKAINYLKILMDHARRVPAEKKCCVGGVFDGPTIHFSQDTMLTYMINSLDGIINRSQNNLKIG